MPLSLRFADEEEEQQFLVANRGEQAAHFWKVIIVGLAIVWGFVWQDNLISPNRGYIATNIRLYALTPAGVLGVWLLARREVALTLIEPLNVLIYIFFALCGIAIEVVFEGTKFGLSSSVGGGTLLLLILTAFTFTHFRFWWSLAVGVIILIMYMGGIYWFTPMPFEDFLAGDFLTTITAGLMGASSSLFRERALREQFRASQRESRKSEKDRSLLYMMVPEAIVERIQNGEFPIAESHAEVTILFADLVGFTALTRTRAPRQIVQMLNELFQMFDEAAVRYNVEKIKTIGDGYMAMCGAPVDEVRRPLAVAKLAQEMLSIVDAFSKSSNQKLQLRVGIHTGTVVAGVIGTSRFTFDIWGESVNLASRMESTGLPGRIQISEAAYQRLWKDFEFEPRDNIEVKGVGKLKTFLLGNAKDQAQ